MLEVVLARMAPRLTKFRKRIRKVVLGRAVEDDEEDEDDDDDEEERGRRGA